MRWPWRRKAVPPTECEGAKAVAAARQGLAEEKQKTGEVLKVAGTLRELRERNHFAVMLEASMRHHGEGRGSAS